MSTAEQHLAILAKHLDFENSRILDIGSGGGELSLALSHKGAKVTGIECSRDQMIRAVAKQVKDCNFVFSVGENLPFRDSCFDATVFFNSIHHIPEDSMETAISEAISVTKSGGLVYVAEPLAEGACFELDSPVEDETVIRAQAQQCLNKAIKSHSKFAEDAEECYLVHYDYQNFEEYKDEMLRFDQSRRHRFEQLEELMRSRFQELGKSIDQGVRFYQPMLARCFRVL
ncbi:MAG: class I SAM-dependent methyltransferase [SAR324 cluster bacterium]|nr:class I SAM-dependent methyltransferase [SAR324 cluster bacterium]